VDVIRVAMIPVPHGREPTGAVKKERAVAQEVQDRLDVLELPRTAEPISRLLRDTAE
jgi:hypothetical protein